MIIRSVQATKNINHQIRKEIAMAVRLVRRSTLLNRIPPIEVESNKKKGLTRQEMMSGLILLITLGICLWIGCSISIGAEIPEKKAIKSIVGEAESQGFEGMLAVAHSLRNRGTLKGVYGLRSLRIRHHLYSRHTIEEATLAWEQSAIDYDITHGSTGWGNINDVHKFEMCRWWNHCVVTAVIKDHVFYKELK